MRPIYPATMTEAMPEKSQVAEAYSNLERAGVKYIFSCWIDILGVPKTKPVPLSELEALCAGKGPQFAVHSVSMVPELGPADPDQIPIPDLDSLQVCPWDRTLAFVFADLFYKDKPYDVCPRLALKRQIKLAADAGYRFFAGFEPEFMVMKYTADGRPIKAFDNDPPPGLRFRPRRQAFGYDAEFSLDAMPYLGEIIDHMNGLGWQVKNVVCEGAYSQFELDFWYADVLTMADRFVFLRTMLKEITKRHGNFVTFMPKPTQGDWRNGAHINHSVQSVKSPGVNLLSGKDGGWSDVTHHVLGGLMKHAPALTAVACSTVNSYKGLIGRARDFEGGTITWAPTHVSYGTNNRSAMLRLPLTRHAIENRAADMCLNPYLALAMTVAASLEGIQMRIDPGPPTEGSLYELGRKEGKAEAKPLPANLSEAIAAFDQDALAKSVFGPTMHNSYSRYKNDEWARFHEHITEWEQREYLRYF
jgi:glutamine synthetase